MKNRLATDIERTCGVQLTATAQVKGSTRQMACGQAATGNVYFPISLLMNIPYAVNVPPAVLVAPVISSFLQSKRDGGGRKQKGLQTSREEEKVSILALIRYFQCRQWSTHDWMGIIVHHAGSHFHWLLTTVMIVCAKKFIHWSRSSHRWWELFETTYGPTKRSHTTKSFFLHIWRNSFTHKKGKGAF